MRTGHFSPEKQTVEIRIRGQWEGEGGGRESILQLYRAYLRVSPRETIRIISIPRTEGLCNAIGWRRYSAACGHGIELPNSGNACVWRVRLVPLPFLLVAASIGKIKSRALARSAAKFSRRKA